MSKRRRRNKRYSEELRIEAVEAYLRGEGSQREICKRYEIRDAITLREWIKWYNGHREMKRRNTAKGDVYMTKGKKTTQEERIEIGDSNNNELVFKPFDEAVKNIIKKGCAKIKKWPVKDGTPVPDYIFRSN